MAEYLINAVEISNSQVAVEVLLNDGRLMRVLDEPEGNWVQKGNALLVQGDNEVKLSVRPLPDAVEIDPRATVELKIFEGPFGGHPGEIGKVHEFTWSQAGAPVSGSGFRLIHQKKFPTRAAQGRWGWEDATPFTAADESTIVAIVAALHTTLVARDYGAFAALNAVRDAELATALDVSLQTLVNSDRQMLEALMQKDDWQVQPLDQSALEMHESARGRLVEVTGPNKSGPLVAGTTLEQMDFPLTFSNLPDIGWTVTR